MSDPISYGDPLARCLHLAFERDYDGRPYRDAVCRAVYDRWQGLGIRVTDRRPAWYPGVYATAVLVIDLPPGRSALLGDQEWWLPLSDPRFNPYRTHVALVVAMADPIMTAVNVAHEAGHGCGLLDDTVPHSLMNGASIGPSSRFKPEDRAKLLARTSVTT